MRGSQPESIKRGSSPFPRSVRIGALFGIDIHLDASVVVIFVLVVWILGASVFPSWHPQWSAALNWTTSVLAGAAFFISLLLHELAHSLMARRYGVPVPRITLFMLGGVSEMQDEPANPQREFWIAIVGPATSALLGVLCGVLASMLAAPDFAQRLAQDQAGALASLAPLPTLLFWLGSVNFVLALFNMLPGFPLDGGRVLRAAVWWYTGNLEKATRWAAAGGRGFGWALVLLGVFQVLGGALQGLWLVLIGWFIISAASGSYSQLMMRQALHGCRVADVMRTHFETVDANLSIAEFIDDFLLKSSQRLWPVTSQERLAGFASLDDIRDIAPQDRGRPLRDVMRTDLDDLTLQADADAMQATQRLALRTTPMAVVRGDQVVGLLSQDDLMKWLTLHRR